MTTIIINNKEFATEEYEMAMVSKKVLESMNYDSWKDNLVGLYLYGQIMKAQKNSREKDQ